MALTTQLRTRIGGLRGPGGIDGAAGTDGADGADGVMAPDEVRQVLAGDGVIGAPTARQFGSEAGLFLRSLAGEVDTTRATTGWSIGNGMMLAVAANYPRVSDRGLQVAGARVQKITTPTDYSTWTAANGATQTASAYAPPNGVTATKITGAGSSSSRYTKAFDLTVATSHVVLMLVKNDPANGATRSSFYIDKTNDADTELEWLWDGDKVAAYRTETNITGYRPIHVGGGWWIVGGVFTSDSLATSHNFQIRPDKAALSDAMHVAQYDCYEGTQIADLLRNATDNADTWRVPVAMDSVFTASADFEVPRGLPATASPILTLDNGDADTNDALRVYIDSAGKVHFLATLAGVTIAEEVCDNAALASTDMRATLLVSPTHYRFWVGDNLIGSGVFSDDLPAISRFMLGEDGAGNKLNSAVGTVTLANGDLSAEIIAASPVAKLTRLHGQSNADGRGGFLEVSSAQYTYRQMHGYLWDAPDAFSSDDFTTDASFQRIHWTSSGSNLTMSSTGELGMESPLLHGRDRNTFLAKYAIGGTQLAEDAGIDDWDPDSTGEYYDKANECFEAARDYLLGAGYKTKCTELVWFQGERDGDDGTMTAAYQANLTALGDAWLAYHDALGDDDWKFVVVQLGDTQTDVANLASIQAAQAAMVAARPAYALLADIGAVAVQGDNLHLTGQGQVTAGLAVNATLRAAGVFV